MSYVKIWVHLVFSTKTRNAFLLKRVRHHVQQHIISNCEKKDIYLQSINGYTDHLHCLISLGKDQSIAQVARLIKGESSHWINKNQLIAEKFIWQDDYFAVSISESQVAKVVAYIKDQENHHASKPFSEEVEEFMTNYGFSVLKDEK